MSEQKPNNPKIQIKVQPIEDILKRLSTSSGDGKEAFKSETTDLDKAKHARYVSDTDDRKWLAQWAACVVTIWLFFVLIILLENHDNIRLSDTVLNVLLGTTTLNVLGLMAIVLRGHFGDKE